MDRRDFVLTAGASLAAPLSHAARSSEAGITDTEILIGQSAVLSGPLSPGAIAMRDGAQLAFDDINAQGGIAGRRIRLLALDDGFDPAKAQANYQTLINEHKVFACFCGVGAFSVLAGLPLLRASGTPLIGATAVVDSARDTSSGVAYYTRASQQREADVLVQHLSTLGLTRITMAYIGTPGGKEVLGQVELAARQRGVQLLGSVGVAPDGKNVVEAGKALAQFPAQATLLFLSGPAAAQLMKVVWAQGGGTAFYGMSILAGDVTAKLLGDQFRGLTVSEVTPYPWDAAYADAIQYRNACEKAQVPVGYHSYEGYISGRVLVEALRQTGREPTRARLHATLRKLKMRVGGMDIDFTGDPHTGARFVELVRVRQDGRFLR